MTAAATGRKTFVARKASNAKLCALLLAAAICLLAAQNAATADDKIKDLLKSLGSLELELVEAHVPDLDPLPMQKESDVFARVYLNNTKELVCETSVVQDENKPKVSALCKRIIPVRVLSHWIDAITFGSRARKQSRLSRVISISALGGRQFSGRSDETRRKSTRRDAKQTTSFG